jgi:hypothetical protein
MKCRVFLCPQCGHDIARIVSDEVHRVAQLLERAVTRMGRVIFERNQLRAQLEAKEGN